MAVQLATRGTPFLGHDTMLGRNPLLFNLLWLTQPR